MENYDLTLEQCCNDVQMSMYFGMFLTSRQTDEEWRNNETIEDNKVGWNKPDSFMSNAFILLIEEFEATGKITITLDHRKFHTHKLSKSLRKYKKQYKEFIKSQPYKEKIKIEPKQSELF